MRKTLLYFFCMCAGNASAQIFSQDFNSSTSINNYRTIANAAEANKFTQISSFSNAPAAIISNFLRWDKKGKSAAYMVRNDEMVSPTPTFMKLQFKFRVNAPSTFGENLAEDIVFYIGDDAAPSVWPAYNSADAPPDAAVHTKFSIKLHMVETPASQEFSICDEGTKYSGWRTITVIANNSGSQKDYYGPNGLMSSVADDTFDIWVDNDNLIDDAAAVTAGVALKKFKFICPSEAPNAILNLDDFIVFNETVLPVVFTSFTAKKEGSAVKLNWLTASETNNSHFEVLRAGDQSGFKVISTVKSKGNSNQQSNYVFTDQLPLQGNNYYKIRQVDFDGKTAEYPNTLNVYVGLNKQSFYVSIDKSTQQLKVNLQSIKSYRDQLQVVDMNGKILLTKEVYVRAGQNVFQLADLLTSGLYIVRFKEAGYTTKFVK